MSAQALHDRSIDEANLVYAMCHEISNLVAAIRLQAHLLDEDLDARGLLRHHMLDRDDWRQAVDHPPADTRAKVRGECVERWSKNPKDYNCNWSRVRGRDGFVDLSDPFETTVRWVESTTLTPLEDLLLDGWPP